MPQDERFDLLDSIDALLRRAVRECIREARADRERQRAAKERHDALLEQLVAAQKVTEEKLQRYLRSRRADPNR